MFSAFRKAPAVQAPSGVSPPPPSAISDTSLAGPRAGGAGAASTRLSFLHRLFAPLDISTLVFFRIGFGAIMLWEVYRYFANDWIARYFIAPRFHFTYYGFDWVRPWPAMGMYWHFYALGVLAVCIILGLSYRLAAILFFLGFTYVFLLEQAIYLNHFYLVSLISFVMIFVPAHRAFSLDALLDPKVRSQTAPTWALWLLRLQIGVPYFFGGVAKINEDWLRGEPFRAWLYNRTDRPILGALFTNEPIVMALNYGGLLLDLLVVPFLLWRRTRLVAYAAAVIFHLMNAWLFRIGIFPWFMIVATLMFFPPDWPRKALRLVRRSLVSIKQWSTSQIAGAVSSAGRDVPRPVGGGSNGAGTADVQALAPLQPAQRLIIAALGLYVAFQLLFPLRHFLYPGNVSWTEQGHRFSWHMKLRDKSAEATFYATDPNSGTTWPIDPLRYIKAWQYEDMTPEPDMILLFAHHVAQDLRRQGYQQIEVRANVTASLNGRRKQPLIDPTVDLAAQPRNLWPASWIVPLYEPFRASRPRPPRTVS